MNSEQAIVSGIKKNDDSNLALCIGEIPEPLFGTISGH